MEKKKPPPPILCVLGEGRRSCLGCRALGLKVGVRAGGPRAAAYLPARLCHRPPQACLPPPASCVGARQAHRVETCRSVFISWSRASGRSLGGPARTFLQGVTPVQPLCFCQGFPCCPPSPAHRGWAQGAGRRVQGAGCRGWVQGAGCRV